MMIVRMRFSCILKIMLFSIHDGMPCKALVPLGRTGGMIPRLLIIMPNTMIRSSFTVLRRE